jgi:hypothetical protein
VSNALILDYDMVTNLMQQMGIYAGLGSAQAITMFAMGAFFALMSFYASVSLHRVRFLVSLRPTIADSLTRMQ